MASFICLVSCNPFLFIYQAVTTRLARRLHFLRRLRLFGFQPGIMLTFYNVVLQSIIWYGMAAWSWLANMVKATTSYQAKGTIAVTTDNVWVRQTQFCRSRPVRFSCAVVFWPMLRAKIFLIYLKITKVSRLQYVSFIYQVILNKLMRSWGGLLRRFGSAQVWNYWIKSSHL